MARCPYLEYHSGGIFFGTDTWTCSLTGLEMKDSDPAVKHKCNSDSGDAYEQCPVYKDR